MNKYVLLFAFIVGASVIWLTSCTDTSAQAAAPTTDAQQCAVRAAQMSARIDSLMIVNAALKAAATTQTPRTATAQPAPTTNTQTATATAPRDVTKNPNGTWTDANGDTWTMYKDEVHQVHTGSRGGQYINVVSRSGSTYKKYL